VLAAAQVADLAEALRCPHLAGEKRLDPTTDLVTSLADKVDWLAARIP
jgi:hypothetical protein